MNADKISKLLGRPLTSTETTNFDLYLKIARENLSEMICTDLCGTDTKYFETRDGYRTVFTDIFSEIDTVTLDGKDVEYVAYQNDKRGDTLGWYNSIVISKCDAGELEITADWGFHPMPVDLQLLLARLFGLVSTTNNSNGNIKSKRVEDFNITFNDNTQYDQFMMDNRATISKYSQCNVGYIRHGRVCSIYQ